MKRWLCILGLDSFFLLCNIVLLVHYGFFGDVYPNVKVDKDIIYFTWISLVLTALGLGVVLRNVITQPKVKKKKKMLIIFVLFCLFGTNLYYGSRYYHIVNKKYINTEKRDYIASEHYYGISLAELKTDIKSNEQIVIYIGRADCTDCFNFEKKLEQTLKECQVELPTYYTSKDRDGENSREMYQLLERFGITSVPAIIVTQNSKLEKRWLDPEKYLDEIQTYIKKMY